MSSELHVYEIPSRISEMLISDDELKMLVLTASNEVQNLDGWSPIARFFSQSGKLPISGPYRLTEPDLEALCLHLEDAIRHLVEEPDPDLEGVPSFLCDDKLDETYRTYWRRSLWSHYQIVKAMIELWDENDFWIKWS